MKQLLTAFAAFLALAAAAQRPQKRALLIAVGDYPEASGWQKINSANDLVLVEKALEQHGFRAENVRSIRDSEASRAGILAAIRADLLEKAEPGGVLFFQFSGHGQQVADDSGDEIDGFDEAIVPFDSPMRYGSAGGYEGQNLVRDDEIGELFEQIRRRLGPSGSLTVVLDACHSGTGTRGAATARGTSFVMADSAFLAEKRPAHRGSAASESAVFDEKNDDAGLAPMAAFFGASANQLNFEARDDEGRPCGSLTYAFCKKLAESGSRTSYRGLFDGVRLEMADIAPRQSPQAEGQLDREIFGGSALEKPRFFKAVRLESPARCRIDAGWMHGAAVGSTVGFFVAETRDFAAAAPVVAGRIIESQAFESTVELETEVPKAELFALWAFVTEQNFGDLEARVRLDLDENDPVRVAFLQKIASFSAIKIDAAQPDLVIEKGQSRGAATGARLVTAQDFLIEQVAPSLAPAAAADLLIQKTLAFAQADFLKKLEMSSPRADIDFEIVPIELDRRTGQKSRDLPLAEKTDGSGLVRLREGDAFQIRVSNRGERAAFFTLIDLQPDAQINILLPADGETPAEMRLAAGETRLVPRIFEIAPPLGMEIFKLISTEQPIDLRPIAASRGASTRAANSPIEQLFSQSFGGQTQSRGGRTSSVAAGAMTARTLAFLIE